MMTRRTFLGTAIALVFGLFILMSYGIRHHPQPYALAPTTSTSSSQVSGVRVPENAATSTYTPRAAPQGQKEYHNLTYRFSLFYPDDLSLTTYHGAGSTLTLTFQTTDGSKGFQIFVTPYGASQVTPERFKMDEPSGVMASSTNIMLDGVSATVFFGSNTAMGDTREVWAIYHGFLFEVSTYKDLDAWLSQIMSTWQFLPV